MSDRVISYGDAIREATIQSMEKDENVFVFGLGANYNSAPGVKDMYPERVFDTPNSEACTTSSCVGAALNGLRPIIHHDRVEFGMYAYDAIITQAAKWNYSFGGGNPVPMVVRLVVGRQWGTGPQHSQSSYALFGNATGLKCVIPSTPYMAKGLLNAAVSDNNPVVVLEPLWLKSLQQNVPEEYYEVPLDKAHIVQEGNDITLVSYGDGMYDCTKALEMLEDSGVSVELIDLVSINPVDYETIFNSLRKTGRLLTVDTCNDAFNVGSEVVSKVSTDLFGSLKEAPVSLSTPNVPVPTSYHLTKDFYPTKLSIANKILEIFDKDPLDYELSFDELNFGPKEVI